MHKNSELKFLGLFAGLGMRGDAGTILSRNK